MKTSMIIVLLAYFSNLIEGAIKCYTCDSRNVIGCEKTFGYTQQQAESANIIKECKENETCRKMSVHSYRGDFVIRECTDSALTGCREIKDEAVVCDCQGNLCNGQGSTTISYGLLSLLLVIFRIFARQ